MSLGEKMLWIFLGVFTLFAILVILSSYTFHREEIVLENKMTSLKFSVREFLLLSVKDKVTEDKYEFEKSSLWNIYLLDTSNVVDNILNNKCRRGETCLIKISSLDEDLSKSYTIRETDKDKILILNWFSQKYNIKVNVNISLPKDSYLSYWSINVENNNEKLALWIIDFPTLKIRAINNDKENTYLAIPFHSGNLIKNPVNNIHWNASPIEEVTNNWDKDTKLNIGTYPGTYSMQFAAIYGDKGGLYLAAYDGEMYSKRFLFNGDNKLSLLFTLRQFPENMLSPRNSYFSPYKFVLGVFQGDWMNAAEIYRKWATKQLWTKKGALYTWYDLSRKIYNLNFGICVRYLNISRYNLVKENILAMKQFFDTIASINKSKPNYGIHFVGWSKYLDVTSEKGNIDFFPAQPGFKDLVDELKKYDIFSDVYMGVGVFDQRMPLDEKSKLYWRDAKPYAAYNPFNEYYIRFRKAWMCPYTSWWQELLSSDVPQAQSECHIDGIYWDHYPAMKLCFSKLHGHPLGGGNYYSIGFREMARRIREVGKKIDSDFFTYNEGKCEIEIGVFDGFLNEFYLVERGSLFDMPTFYYGNMRGDPIPLVTYVYHDYAIMIGGFRAREGHKSFSDPNQFAYVNAYAWVCGNKLGFVDHKNMFLEWKRGLLSTEWIEILNYLGNLVKMSVVGNEFLTLGRYVRPPIFKNISYTSLTYYNMPKKFPTILSGAFRMPNGTTYIALTNWFNKTQDIKEIDFSKCNWLPYRFELSILTDKGIKKIGVFTQKKISVNLTLKPRSALFLIIRGLEKWREQLDNFYDIGKIKNMSLDELKWRKIEEREVNGVKIIVGEWEAGKFTTFDKQGNLKTITLHEKSILYYPRNPIMGKGFVVARHIEGLIYNKEYIDLANEFKIPILTHGECKIDWEELGFQSRDEITHTIFNNLMSLNKEEVKDVVTGNFVLALARTNSMAITLLQRLCQKFGNDVNEIAIMGGSKEGYAAWYLSSIDDRVIIVSPGGYQLINLIYGIELMEKDWGCINKNLAPGWHQPKYLLKFRKWLISEDSGRIISSLFNIAFLKNKFKPKFYIIFGGVGSYGTHDGRLYPIGAETPFLKSFNKPWRYQRIRNNDEVNYKRFIREATIVLALIKGIDNVLNIWPKIDDVRYEIRNNSFRVNAIVNGDVDKVYLVWSYSRDRVWNSKEVPPWIKVEMRRENNIWVSDWVRRPDSAEIGFYIEAESSLTRKIENYEIRYMDCSPVEFLFMLPEKTCKD